ncbi:MAG: hypothetical protein EON47_23565, partial [Acetobacteraceae bacterium]
MKAATLGATGRAPASTLRVVRRNAFCWDDAYPWLSTYGGGERRRLSRLLLESQDFMQGCELSDPQEAYAAHKVQRDELGDLVFLFEVSVRHRPELLKYAVLLAAYVCRADADGEGRAISAAARLGATGAQLRLLAGEFLLRTQQRAPAIDLLQAALRGHEDRLLVLERLAWAHCHADDLAAAAEVTDAATAEAGRLGRALSWMGRAACCEVLLYRQRWAEASDQLREAVLERPTQAAAHLGLAIALGAQHLRDEAIEAAQAALAHAPCSALFCRRLVAVCRGLCAPHLLQDVYRLALRAAPGDAE